MAGRHGVQVHAVEDEAAEVDVERAHIAVPAIATLVSLNPTAGPRGPFEKWWMKSAHLKYLWSDGSRNARRVTIL